VLEFQARIENFFFLIGKQKPIRKYEKGDIYNRRKNNK
jgi:hypothetical protein